MIVGIAQCQPINALMAADLSEEQARRHLVPFLASADLNKVTAGVVRKHLEQKLGLEDGAIKKRSEQGKWLGELTLTITKEVAAKKRKVQDGAKGAAAPRKAKRAAPPRQPDSSDEEAAASVPTPSTKPKLTPVPVDPRADERPEWVRPEKGPRDSDDSSDSEEDTPAESAKKRPPKPAAKRAARPTKTKKSRPADSTAAGSNGPAQLLPLADRAAPRRMHAMACVVLREGSDEEMGGDEADSSENEILSGDEAVMAAGDGAAAADALYVPLAKQRAPRVTTSAFAKGRPTEYDRARGSLRRMSSRASSI